MEIPDVANTLPPEWISEQMNFTLELPLDRDYPNKFPIEKENFTNAEKESSIANKLDSFAENLEYQTEKPLDTDFENSSQSLPPTEKLPPNEPSYKFKALAACGLCPDGELGNDCRENFCPPKDPCDMCP